MMLNSGISTANSSRSSLKVVLLVASRFVSDELNREDGRREWLCSLCCVLDYFLALWSYCRGRAARDLCPRQCGLCGGSGIDGRFVFQGIVALAVLGGLLQMRIGALGVKKGVRGSAAGSESTAGMKAFRKRRPGELVEWIVS